MRTAVADVMRLTAVLMSLLIALPAAALAQPGVAPPAAVKPTTGQCRDATSRVVSCASPKARTDAEGVPLSAKAAAARNVPRGRPLGPAGAAPPGAVALCKDGTFAMARQGAPCASHGGVGQRLSGGG